MEANTIEWLDPWFPVTEATVREALKQELLLEVAKGHVLFGQRVAALARRFDRDDVLFELEESQRLAVVYLSYASRPDPPPWPDTNYSKE